jgi:uncharacterized protein YjbJ (UPF0337 family)
MNWDTIEGKWTELKGQVHSKWAKLTDDDFKEIGGRFEELVGRLQQRYGHDRDEAEREVHEFVRSVPNKPSRPRP